MNVILKKVPKWGSNFFFTFPTSEGSDLLSSHVMQTPTFISKLSDGNVIFRLDVGKIKLHLLLLLCCFAICPTNVVVVLFLFQFICLHAQMSFDSWLWNCESNQSDCLLEHRSCNRNVNIGWFKIIVDKSGNYVRKFIWQLCG
jgi:hypothetical protein